MDGLSIAGRSELRFGDHAGTWADTGTILDGKGRTEAQGHRGTKRDKKKDMLYLRHEKTRTDGGKTWIVAHERMLGLKQLLMSGLDPRVCDRRRTD